MFCLRPKHDAILVLYVKQFLSNGSIDYDVDVAVQGRSIVPKDSVGKTMCEGRNTLFEKTVVFRIVKNDRGVSSDHNNRLYYYSNEKT